MEQKKITFIGAGNMASSLIGGLLQDGYDKTCLLASDPSDENRSKMQQQFAIGTQTNNAEAVAWADVVVLAVKPQIMAAVCQDIVDQGADLSGKLFVSIAAGISVSRLQGILGNVPVVRTMPNTPALLQLGMTGLFASAQVSDSDKTFAGDLMAAVGKTVWVEDEAQINGIIAASGSAPAYFFLFMEAMEQTAIEMGFTPEQARLLVQQSALGSAQMVVQNPDLDLATLRTNVTSKGGTTAEAVRTFNEQGLADTVKQAMTAAAKRGAQMEQLF
ncbi:pyrroline-5-carboxylate reductase [Motilimonas sp. E26]|uniref:pyrroline-5-carboxylate reductase n=1 Tax=Motilimonas TaxID=1914248 RepID=UPI001E651DE0|nr:pyrroline-5-carboxylate reductase [Motilimonas sp. E26]MCE0558191.1 pyrroline-5-carboxylate reductase [Motilimonas sp. E26]